MSAAVSVAWGRGGTVGELGCSGAPAEDLGSCGSGFTTPSFCQAQNTKTSILKTSSSQGFRSSALAWDLEAEVGLC